MTLPVCKLSEYASLWWNSHPGSFYKPEHICFCLSQWCWWNCSCETRTGSEKKRKRKDRSGRWGDGHDCRKLQSCSCRQRWWVKFFYILTFLDWLNARPWNVFVEKHFNVKKSEVIYKKMHFLREKSLLCFDFRMFWIHKFESKTHHNENTQYCLGVSWHLL